MTDTKALAKAIINDDKSLGRADLDRVEEAITPYMDKIVRAAQQGAISYELNVLGGIEIRMRFDPRGKDMWIYF